MPHPTPYPQNRIYTSKLTPRASDGNSMGTHSHTESVNKCENASNNAILTHKLKNASVHTATSTAVMDLPLPNRLPLA